ncbi:MAG: hypothetical protein ACI9RO_000436, partial [Alteromonas macleodii]
MYWGQHEPNLQLLYQLPYVIPTALTPVLKQ